MWERNPFSIKEKKKKNALNSVKNEWKRHRSMYWWWQYFTTLSRNVSLKKKTNFKETNKFLGADQIDKNKVTRNCTPTDTRKFTEYSEKYHILNFVRASTGNFVSWLTVVLRKCLNGDGISPHDSFSSMAAIAASGIQSCI